MKNQDDSKETKLRKIEICTDRALKKAGNRKIIGQLKNKLQFSTQKIIAIYEYRALNCTSIAELDSYKSTYLIF
jgi:hypothetical protein